MTGCNSLPVELLSKATKVEPVRKDVVPDEIREIAQNAIDYGDYYMKEFAENSKNYPNDPPDFQILKTGLELISEEREKISEISTRLFPKLEPESVKVSKQCYLRLFEYNIYYLNVQMMVSGYAIGFSDYATYKAEWDKAIQSRAKIIKDCQL
jgi:hypothetical protein